MKEDNADPMISGISVAKRVILNKNVLIHYLLLKGNTMCSCYSNSVSNYGGRADRVDIRIGFIEDIVTPNPTQK